MMIKSIYTEPETDIRIDCACAYPSCTPVVGRARLLYQILHTTGLDETREIRLMR
ncbi:MAG: hypothetical protein LUQ31_02975 [Methanoregula sp.]|nr:hypothetical protein [Methanoregula sp.]